MINILYVLMGASSVGKDKLVNELRNKYNIPICVSSSTRPKRENEVEGKDYFFISEEEFLRKLNNNEFLETRNYKTANGIWHYGLDKKAVNLNETQLVILDAQGYKTVVKALGQKNVVGVYIYANEREKIIRALNREPNREDSEYFKELYRRLLDDMTAFDIIKNDKKVFKVQNKNGEFDKAVKEIWNIINNKNQFTNDKTKEIQDFVTGDRVKVIKIINPDKASHLENYINKFGYVFSWIIKNNIKRYKIMFKDEDTAYFTKDELKLLKVGDEN